MSAHWDSVQLELSAQSFPSWPCPVASHVITYAFSLSHCAFLTNHMDLFGGGEQVDLLEFSSLALYTLLKNNFLKE